MQIFFRTAFAAVALAFCFPAASQTNDCSDNAAGQIASGSSCSYTSFHSTDDNGYWNAATGCGAADNDDSWAWFTATNNYSTVQYNPLSGFFYGTPNPILTVFDGTVGNCSVNMPAIACSNNFGDNGTEAVTFPTVIGQRYRVRIQRQGSNGNMYGNVCVVGTATPPPTNTSCTVQNPICSGSPISFIANAGGNPASVVNPGNTYGCLNSTPNPSWYYMEITQSGNLAINITAGSDVDFRLWGPFANLATAQAGCNSYGGAADCSYSTSATEQANASVLAGQTWVLLVTNYANTVQTININEAGSNTAATNCAIVPLPVGYTQWDAAYIDRKVVLTWATDVEEDNKQFIVQRSKDGLVWETLGAVAGNGTSSADHDYQYIDEQPLDGISYYRLLQIDINGTPSYTSILSVNSNKPDNFAVYPNPAKDHFTVRTNNKTIGRLTISNAVGQLFDIPVAETAEGLQFDCRELVKGIYTVTIVSGNGVQTERIVIGG